MVDHTFLLIDSDSEHCLDTFEARSSDGSKVWSVKLRTLRGGVSEGVAVLEVRTDRASCEIIPTRGMGLWRAVLNGVPLGWESPIGRPVHPAHVPITEPSGVGFLDGVTEFMFRCGLESNGAPEFDAHGRLRFPLHGRIANTPSSYLKVEVDGAGPTIRVTGRVAERRFLGQKLLLTTEYELDGASGALRWTDTVTNLGGTPALMQMLYHINFGKPFLTPGARIVAPAVRVCPRDVAAANAGVDSWPLIPPQSSDFAERVYLMQLACDADAMASVVLHNAAGDAGVNLCFCVRDLPCFTVWQNSQQDEDGFVAGLEPGVNFPNPRSFEQQHGRIVSLSSGDQWQTTVTLRGLGSAIDVGGASQKALALLGKHQPELLAAPLPAWSANA